MKTLYEIKDEVAKELAKEYGWKSCYGEDGITNLVINEVAHRFAIEVAREALKNASENAIMKYHCGHFKTDTPTRHHQQGADNIQIDKQSILDEKNIPI